MPPSPSMADNFKLFQDLAQRVAGALQIPLQGVTELHQKLVDILHSSTSSRVALPINETLLDPTKIIWQTPASVPPTCKWACKKYYVPAKDTGICFHTHLPILILWMQLFLRAANTSLSRPFMTVTGSALTFFAGTWPPSSS